jgi:NADH:ubiquinone oxidoreductase subunit 2 (subunit N)
LLTSNNNFENIIYLYSYLYIYNVTLIFFFWSFMNFIIIQYKTLFFLNNLKFNFFYTFVFTACLFSMAGVPPFLGFFSKLFILLIASASTFSIFYIFFFILLFLGLYFYIQNIRYALTSQFSNINLPSQFQLIHFYNYYLLSVFFLIFILLGFFFLDDVILFFTWIFV